MTLYVDGKKVGHNAGTTSRSGLHRLLARSAATTSAAGRPTVPYFNGSIDDVAIYPTALTARPGAAALHRQRPHGQPCRPRRPTRTALAVYNSGPDSYWRLDETVRAGRQGRHPPNGADGVYSGGVTQGAAGGVAGTSDTAVTFNGVDGAVASGAVGIEPDDLLRGAVVQDHDHPGRQADRLRYAARPASSSGYDRHVYMVDDGRLRFGVWTGQTNVDRHQPSRTTTASWHHMVATQGPDGMKLYVDGVLVGTNPQTQAQAYDGYWRVGGDNTWGGNSSNYFAGSIDEVAVYSSALSASTVTGSLQGRWRNRAERGADGGVHLVHRRPEGLLRRHRLDATPTARSPPTAGTSATTPPPEPAPPRRTPTVGAGRTP